MKIFVSDYDNTFYTDSNNILENVLNVNEMRKNDVLFVIATSRSFSSIKKEIEKYSIQYDYLICDRGSTLFDNNDNLLDVKFVPKIHKKYFKKIIKNYSSLKMTFFGPTNIFSNDNDNIIGYKIEGENNQLNDFVIEIKKNKKSMIVQEDKKIFLSFSNDKSIMLKKLIKLLKINCNECVVIGDDDMDYQMLMDFDGYRMNNSSLLIKKAIKKEVLSVSELIKKSY